MGNGATKISPKATLADSAARAGQPTAARGAAKTPAAKPEKSEKVEKAGKAIDLAAPEYYLNRELTWLTFNRRVLHEAADPRTPLLERVKFLAIVSSNLDEFFMKRIGGLKQQVGAGVHSLTVDGRTPGQQITECIEEIKDLQREKRVVFLEVLEQLRKAGIAITHYDRLPKEQQHALREHYFENIFPLVTPLAMDPAHPFPFMSNLSLNLLVTLSQSDGQEHILARVKVPLGGVVPRFLQAKTRDAHVFVPLEDVMAHNLDLLFPGMEIESCEFFRVTRNANTEHDEEQADDLLAMIEAELRDRKFAPIVRLQVNQAMDPVHRGMLAAELGLDEATDVFDLDVMIALCDLMEIATLDLPDLRDAPHHPLNNTVLQDDRSIFHVIREAGSILLHHPYDSFATSVERFVREAASDPKVLALKMSLYRTSADTRIIESLI